MCNALDPWFDLDEIAGERAVTIGCFPLNARFSGRIFLFVTFSS